MNFCFSVFFIEWFDSFTGWSQRYFLRKFARCDTAWTHICRLSNQNLCFASNFFFCDAFHFIMNSNQLNEVQSIWIGINSASFLVSMDRQWKRAAWIYELFTVSDIEVLLEYFFFPTKKESHFIFQAFLQWSVEWKIFYASRIL